MNNIKINTEQEFDTLSIKNFLLLCLGYWKWFLLSIVVFVGFGLFYIYTRQPVYERSEEILVKDQESGGGMDVTNSFSQLGLFSSSTKVYNELISFTSPAVMFEVVKRLDLMMNYNLQKGLRKQTLYGTNLPYNFEFLDKGDNDNIGFKIEVKPNGSYEMYKIWEIEPSGIVKYDDKISGKIGGGAVKTPIGRIAVVNNPDYIPSGEFEDGENKLIEVYHQALQLAVEKYVAKLKGDLTDQDADVIKLSISDTSVERADDILNTIVTVYNERWIEDKNKVAVATSKFISERLEIIKDELGLVDDEIAEHKSAIGIPDIEKVADVYVAQDAMMTEQFLQTNNFLAMTTYLKEYLQNPANQYSIIPINTGTNNVVLEEQIGQYNELLLTRNNLAENSGNNNPLVMDKDKALAGMRTSIMRSIDSQITNLEEALKNISKEQSRTRNEISATPKKVKPLLSVERQQLVMEQLFLFLLQKREETELNQTFTADNTRIITPPYGNHKPVSPKKTILIIVFFFIGAGIPAGALFIAETSNTKVRSKKDVENLSIPFAGEIPFIGKDNKIKKLFKSKKRKQKDVDKPLIIVAEGKRDVPNEAFRVVRANLDFMLGKGETSIIALTSFNPGSGKSFIAYNLGASFALKGKKVLIIDGDLRHGSISGYVNSPKKGISNYLTGSLPDWKSVVVPTELNNLSILPVGQKAPNPAELLDNGRLETVIEEAKTEYDIIFIDCPPINIVVDTQIINQYSTRTLFVIRAGLLERKALNDLAILAEEDKLKNITVLLNGTKSEFSQYYSYGNYEAIDK